MAIDGVCVLQAEKLVKAGIAKNIRSHVTWHAYGLMHRAMRNYAEAIKCYRNAVRIDKDNANILRDQSLLQVRPRMAICIPYAPSMRLIHIRMRPPGCRRRSATTAACSSRGACS